MICPNCGTENSTANRFCLKCGHKFAIQNQPPRAQYSIPGYGSAQSVSQNPTSQAAMIGSIAGLVGGGMASLGWFLPWFSLGSLSGLLGNLIGLGYNSGLLNTVGVGNGLQLTMITFIGGLALLGTREGVFLALLALVVTLVLVSIIVASVNNIRLGIQLFELQATSNMNDRSIIWGKMKSLRTGSIYSFIVMAAIFVILSSIPFVTAVLSGGFYLTALGAVVTYLGVLFAQGRLRA